MDLLWEALRDAVGLIARADPELLRIAGLSLAISCAATALVGSIGILLGIALHLGRFVGRAPVTLLVNTGMGMPPVLVTAGVTS
jgi:tungstate transport system permease protein